MAPIHHAADKADVDALTTLLASGASAQAHSAPAHRFLDDQWMLNTVLASAFLRREVYIDSCTKLDDVGRIGSDGNATTPGAPGSDATRDGDTHPQLSASPQLLYLRYFRS